MTYIHPSVELKSLPKNWRFKVQFLTIVVVGNSSKSSKYLLKPLNHKNKQPRTEYFKAVLWVLMQPCDMGGADAEWFNFWCSQYWQRQYFLLGSNTWHGWEFRSRLSACVWLSCSQAGSERPFPSAEIGFHAVRFGTSTGWDSKVRNSSFSCQGPGHSLRSPQLYPCGSPSYRKNPTWSLQYLLLFWEKETCLASVCNKD